MVLFQNESACKLRNNQLRPGGCTLKTHQMLSFRTTPEKINLKTQQSAVILDLCLRKTRAEKIYDYRDATVFEKLRFQNIFRLHENGKQVFSDSFGLKSVFAKLRFHDGSEWTVGLTVEIKLRFRISPAQCKGCLR